MVKKFASDYHGLYSTAAWKRLRGNQLRKNPLCIMCEGDGRVEAATVADHIKPHKGNPDLFFDPDNLQSLCENCHNSAKARIERRGYHTKVDPLTGLPTDSNHPANRKFAR